jgi:hypothetical protein
MSVHAIQSFPKASTRQSSRSELGMSGSFSDRFRSKLVDFSGLVAFLRAEHPNKTAEAVEARCGVPATTVRKWMSGETNPNGKALVLLMLEYGPEAFASCVRCAPDWAKAAVRAEMTRKLESEIVERERQIADLSRA